MTRGSSYCKQCGLQFRIWTRKLEQQVCDECEPEKFKELHQENINNIKKKQMGQEHITEHTFFPKAPEQKYKLKEEGWKYTRTQK